MDYDWEEEKEVEKSEGDVSKRIGSSRLQKNQDRLFVQGRAGAAVIKKEILPSDSVSFSPGRPAFNEDGSQANLYWYRFPAYPDEQVIISYQNRQEESLETVLSDTRWIASDRVRRKASFKISEML